MDIISKNKGFFLFLGKFMLSYIILSAIYMWFLSPYPENVPVTDPITYKVSEQVNWLLNVLGENATIKQHPREASQVVFINKKAIIRVVEGCNAVSVMILFVAFIVAFSTTFKKTFLYIIAGLFVVHFLNIIRIAIICKVNYYLPQYSNFMHDIFFPLFIYGVVFALWVLWVLKFYKNGKKVTA